MVARSLFYAGWAVGLVGLLRGGRTFFNLVLALVGIGWIAFGVAVAID